MDDRVEIIDAPLPLQPHPGVSAAIVRLAANADPNTALNSDGQARNRRQSNIAWGSASLLCLAAAAVSLVLGTNITGLGYAFTRMAQPLFLGWVGILFIIASVICSLVSWAISEPDARQESTTIVRVSLFTSLSAVILLIVGMSIARIIATI